jgi:hypothetical protein
MVMGDQSQMQIDQLNKKIDKLLDLLTVKGQDASYNMAPQVRKLTVVLDYYEAMETYSRIGLLRSYGNL